MNDVFDGFPTLQRCAADVITASELRSKLTAGRPMRIKYGVDVTAPFLHIGHAVNLWAMRELQGRPQSRPAHWRLHHAHWRSDRPDSVPACDPA